jgi:O-antigen/teichoic acid export membrane protein
LSGLIGAGLYLQKKTSVILLIVIASALLKLALGVALIPYLGITAAALSSVAGGVVLLIGLGVGSRPYLHVRLPWGAMLKFASIGVVSFVVMRAVSIDAALWRVAARSTIGALVFCALSIATDAALRKHLAQGFASWSARRKRL